MVTKLVRYEVDGLMFDSFEEAQAYETEVNLRNDLQIFLEAWKTSNPEQPVPGAQSLINYLSTYWAFTRKEGV